MRIKSSNAFDGDRGDVIFAKNYYRHCEQCLTKTSKTGVTTYFHYVLEAKLVTSSGLAISLASEFIENRENRDFDKQDCEQKAFVRLAVKKKNRF